MKKAIAGTLLVFICSTAWGYDSTGRLRASIEAVCPIKGISIGKPGDSASVKFYPAPAATSQEIRDAQDAIAAFDWSDIAHEEWVKETRQKSAVDAYEQDGADQVRLKASVQYLIEQINSLRALRAMPPITQEDAQQAIIEKIKNANP